MKRRPWTSQEKAWLRRTYPDTLTADMAARAGRTVYSINAMASILGLHKSQAYLNSLPSERFLHAGKASRYAQGGVPHNKDIKGFQAGGRSRDTQFKKGARPHTWRPIGSERLTKEGYRQRKITDTGNGKADWVGLHCLLWQQHHGPIPAGHIVVFRNKDKNDIRIENLEMLTRKQNMHRNSVHRLPQALATVCQLKGAVTRQINWRIKNGE